MGYTPLPCWYSSLTFCCRCFGAAFRFANSLLRNDPPPPPPPESKRLWMLAGSCCLLPFLWEGEGWEGEGCWIFRAGVEPTEWEVLAGREEVSTCGVRIKGNRNTVEPPTQDSQSQLLTLHL